MRTKVILIPGEIFMCELITQNVPIVTSISNHAKVSIVFSSFNTELIEAWSNFTQTPVDGESMRVQFVASDIVNGNLTIAHAFNRTDLDVTVFDNANNIVNLGVRVLFNSIIIDLSRVNIAGIWRVLIEPQ